MSTDDLIAELEKTLVEIKRMSSLDRTDEVSLFVRENSPALKRLDSILAESNRALKTIERARVLGS